MPPPLSDCKAPLPEQPASAINAAANAALEIELRLCRCLKFLLMDILLIMN